MRAVIFDMDGVIIDSEPTHRRVEQAFFWDIGLTVDDVEHRSYRGVSSSEMFAEIRRRHRVEWDAAGLTIENAVAEESKRYLQALYGGSVPVMPGITGVIAKLAGEGRSIAVASSAPREQIEFVLRRFELARFVTCAVSADDVEAGKPAPDVFLAAAACLGVPAARCIVVEDAAAGVAAAHAAGMRCIGFGDTADGADVSVSSAAGIAAAIAAWEAVESPADT